MSATKSEILQVIIDLLPNKIPDELSLVKHLKSKKIYIDYRDYIHYFEIQRLKDYYDQVVLAYENNTSMLYHFLRAVKESVLLNLIPTFGIFSEFYSRLVNVINNLASSKSNRPQVIARSLNLDFLDVAKYDYYFKGTLIDKIGPFKDDIIHNLPSKRGFLVHNKKSIIVYNVEYKVISQFEISSNYQWSKLFLSADGRDRIIMQSRAGVDIFDIMDGEMMVSFPLFSLPKIVFGRKPILVFGDNDDIIMIDSETHKEIRRFTGTDASIHNPINDITIMKDKIAAVMHDGTLKLWDMDFVQKPILTKTIEKQSYEHIWFLESLSAERLIFQIQYSAPQIWNIITNEIEEVDIREELLKQGTLRKMGDSFVIYRQTTNDTFNERSNDFIFMMFNPDGTYKYTSQNLKLDNFNINIDLLPNGSLIVADSNRLYIFNNGTVLRDVYIGQNQKIHVLSNGHIGIITLSLDPTNQRLYTIDIYE